MASLTATDSDTPMFFKLATELRLEIYSLVIQDFFPTTDNEPSLLRTCKVFRAEATQTYHSRLLELSQELMTKEADLTTLWRKAESHSRLRRLHPIQRLCMPYQDHEVVFWKHRAYWHEFVGMIYFKENRMAEEGFKVGEWLGNEASMPLCGPHSPRLGFVLGFLSGEDEARKTRAKYWPAGAIRQGKLSKVRHQEVAKRRAEKKKKSKSMKRDV